MSRRYIAGEDRQEKFGREAKLERQRGFAPGRRSDRRTGGLAFAVGRIDHAIPELAQHGPRFDDAESTALQVRQGLAASDLSRSVNSSIRAVTSATIIDMPIW